MKKIILCIVLIGLFIACGGKRKVNELTKIKSNKAKVIELLNSIETGDQNPVGYINTDKYIQHNLGIADGLARFGAKPKEGFKVKVIRAFEDGDYVFTQSEYDFFGPKVGFDVFRFEDGLIVEHWDNLGEKKGPNPSGHTQLDGATEVTDLDRTKENKTLIKNFIKDVLMGENPAKITDYISTKKYIQHNTNVADGLDGVAAARKSMAEAGMTMVFTENHKILGEGNFVLAMSEGQHTGNHVSFYDLFRVEGGKIVEHWDVIEKIPSKDKWANDNGKF